MHTWPNTLYPFQFEEPLFHIHLNVDYPFNLTGILYFPKISNDLNLQKDRIQLYQNQVFVTDNVEGIVPEFLGLLNSLMSEPSVFEWFGVEVSVKFLDRSKPSGAIAWICDVSVWVTVGKKEDVNSSRVILTMVLSSIAWFLLLIAMEVSDVFAYWTNFFRDSKISSANTDLM